MARGLLNGALVGSIGGLVCALFSVFVPMWIVSRTESASKFCWKGAGIWFYGADWGEYIEDLDKQCGKNYFGTVSTKSNYCSSGSKEVSGMCSFLDRSQAISIFAIAFCVLGILFNVIAAAPGMLRRPFGWRLTSISYSVGTTPTTLAIPKFYLFLAFWICSLRCINDSPYHAFY